MSSNKIAFEELDEQDIASLELGYSDSLSKLGRMDLRHLLKKIKHIYLTLIQYLYTINKINAKQQN